jgi:UDP-N-acetylmuramoyl-L-alanyl-D-glutamate--2,6-diaminopimelate ligase
MSGGVTGVAERFDVAGLFVRAGVAPKRITSDSRTVQPGDAFAAFPGSSADGRAFISDAIARGAGVVFWEASQFTWKDAWRVPNIAIDGLRDRYGVIAEFICGAPSGQMWMVGVTGTNGKSSCVGGVAQSFAYLGQRAGIVGTLGTGLVGALASGTHTTPDAGVLQETLARLKRDGAQVVAMEVSSHGLDQGRVNGVAFDVALFTNLTRDHLDYHGTMAAYGAAKARLFAWPGLHASVINRDDAFGQSLAEDVRARGRKVLTYGLGNADVAATELHDTADGLEFLVTTPWGRAQVKSRLIGRFNAWNLLGMLGVLLVSNVPLAQAVEALAHVEPPAGRMQRFGGGAEPLVIVDYAHTPDALEKALTALRPIVADGGELVCVLGCGGNRDAGKRPEMGRIAAELASRVIVTDDNPRREDPMAIAEAILRGVKATGSRRWALEPDRAKAIGIAVANAKPGDVVLVAGKGHETYQERDGVRTPFSDADSARAALAARGSASGARPPEATGVPPASSGDVT